MKKILRIGTTRIGKRYASIYVSVQFENKKLSITGVIGPMISGNALGSCGQICGEFAHRNPQDNDARTYHPITPDEIKYAPEWTADMWLDLLDIWKRWHLNDMRAGCAHQRELGWDKEPIDPSRPTTDYGKFYPGQTSYSWNLKGWVYPPYGYLSAPCPVCGYKYGTAWIHEDVPASVIAWLISLPDTDQAPAWI